MQTLVKTIYSNIKLSGLNANKLIYRFGRMGTKPRKTLAEALTENKEEQETKIKEDKATKFEAYEEPKPKKLPQGWRDGIEIIEKEEEKIETSTELEKPGITDLEEQLKGLDKETKKFIKEELIYPGYDPHPEKLVQRPYKDVVWGLGGQLLRRRAKFFEQGKEPEVEEIIAFLEMEQAKDVVLVDLHEYNRTDLPRWGIILTGYSSRHLYRMAKALWKSIMDVKIPGLINPPRLDGGRDDEWIMVSWKGVMVHMFTEESRKDLDLETKWTTNYDDYVDEEELSMMEKLKEKRKLYLGYKGEE